MSKALNTVGISQRLILPTLLTTFLLPSVLGATTGSDQWVAPEMPSWAVPAAFAILLGVYALIIFELVHRALAAAIGGVVVVLALHTIGDGPDLGTVVTWIDEETIGLLIGMMVIVDILGKTGLFQWAAVQAYALSGGSIWRLSIILCTITAVFSAFLDNVTTILLIVPVTIQIARVLDIEPIPLIIAEVMFSNIGGAATQIGDPPNIIIGAQLSPQALSSNVILADQGISFIDFIIHVGPAVVICMAPSFWLLKKLEMDGLSGETHRNVELLKIRYPIKDLELLKKIWSDISSSNIRILCPFKLSSSNFHRGHNCNWWCCTDVTGNITPSCRRAIRFG